MDITAFKAEVSNHNALVAALPVNAEVVNEIDRHLKSIENDLNERLVHISARYVARNFVPEYKRNRFATKVNEEIWESLLFAKNWHHQVASHEELSYEKCAKGYGLFYTSGEVLFDLGVCEDLDGVDWYFHVLEDRREKHRVIGAPVEVKIRAFQHLKALLDQITHQTEKMSFEVPY